MSFVTAWIHSMMEDRTVRAMKNHQQVADVERLRQKKLSGKAWDQPGYYGKGLGDVPTEAKKNGIDSTLPDKKDWKPRYY
eukprot:CAMPEP_0185265228 /NCGR_PEP_ID=MMETSP1359-20130426/26835_1 /TAXON_ID=552665 /ORGANISM="Bigelowiella longifila, Strain CCMP242" /LENGTH=79 /DNA_ID=CAMNT_0027854385 /DNA_START=112 /DNA_END=351 /DNA_ORIENTATION=-